MTFAELINIVDFDKVLTDLFIAYPEESKNVEGYIKVFKSIKKVKSVPSELTISVTKKHYGDDIRYNVIGFDNCTNTNYALDFSPWQEWLSMPIKEESFDNMSNEEIIAACLYEMTFNGFNNSTVKKTRKKLEDDYKKLVDRHTL